MKSSSILCRRCRKEWLPGTMLLFILLQTAAPGQWPQWRGINRDGTVCTPPSTENWPAQLSPLWKRTIGEGYSGPVVVGDRVWVHSRQYDREVVSCLRLSSGAAVWSQSYAAPFQQDSAAGDHGKGPYATPALANSRLFTFGVSGILSAWDAETGTLLWRKASAQEFSPAFPYFGVASSPLVWNDLCFVHLGGHPRDMQQEGISGGGGAIVALNVSDGQEVWRWSQDGPSVGASPILCEIERRSHLIFKTQQNLLGLDPRTGNPLWQIRFKAPMDNTIVTSICQDGRLITSDYDLGFKAWQMQSSGSEWRLEPLWEHRQVSLFTSSPLLVKGLLVGFSHFRKGQLFILDPEDGKVLWQGEPRSGEHATLISWGDDLLVFLDDGSLVVGKPTRGGFQTMRKYSLGGAGSWGHPALTDNRLLYRDADRLVVYRLDVP